MNRWQELVERISKIKDDAPCGISLSIKSGAEDSVNFVISFVGNYIPNTHGMGHFKNPAIVGGPFGTEDEAYEHLRRAVETLEKGQASG